MFLLPLVLCSPWNVYPGAHMKRNTKHQWSAQLFRMINSFFLCCSSSSFSDLILLCFLFTIAFPSLHIMKKKGTAYKGNLDLLFRFFFGSLLVSVRMMCACAGNVSSQFFPALVPCIEIVIFKYINVSSWPTDAKNSHTHTQNYVNEKD